MSKINTDVTTPNVSRIKEYHKKTYLELAFQRQGGFDNDGGWTLGHGCEFIEAIFNGTALPRITLADINSCARLARDKGEISDAEYFDSLKDRGYDYISIDGNNTSSYLDAYLRDKFTVGGKYFSELPEDLRVNFQSKQIILSVTQNASREEITSLFQNLNKNVQLNAQEIRNGTLTSLAKKVREIKNNEKYDDLFKSCFGPRDCGVRKDDEYIAKCLNNLEYDFKKSNKKNDLDDLYKEKKDSTHFSRLEKIYDAMAAGINSCYKKNKINSRIFDNGSFQQLFLFYQLINKDYDIKNPKEVFECFLKCHQKELEMAQEVKEIDRPEQSYTYWVKDHHTDSKYFVKRIERIKTWLTSAGFLKKGWVSAKRKSYTESQKKQVATHQGWENPVNGKQIHVSNLPEYEIDHKQPLSRGGTNEFANLQLLKKKDNRRKGSQTMYEYMSKKENKL